MKIIESPVCGAAQFVLRRDDRISETFSPVAMGFTFRHSKLEDLREEKAFAS